MYFKCVFACNIQGVQKYTSTLKFHTWLIITHINMNKVICLLINFVTKKMCNILPKDVTALSETVKMLKPTCKTASVVCQFSLLLSSYWNTKGRFTFSNYEINLNIQVLNKAAPCIDKKKLTIFWITVFLRWLINMPLILSLKLN